MAKAARNTLLAASLALLAAGAGPSPAQDGQPPRYSLTPAGEGFLRLDSSTGAVSHCVLRDGNWVCQSVADDRVALQEEIDRLSRENAELKARLAGKVPAAEGDPKQEAQPAEKAPPGVTLHLPEGFEEDLRSLRGYLEKLYRDLREFAGRLKEGPEPRQL